MRNSDPDAAVYWLARMVEAGEDPLYIARRLVRFASEDIGNADPQALTVAVAAKDAVHFIGMPEGNTALAQAAIYLATAPKSNAVYEAYNARRRGRAQRRRRAGAAAPAQRADQADEGIWTTGRATSTRTTRPRRVADMDCLPPALEGRRYYEPTDRGFEKEIKRRLDGWEEIKKKTPRLTAIYCRYGFGDDVGASARRACRDAASSCGHLPEHLVAQRQDEREAVVALHPADRDADELAVAVQHAAARHAGMAVGQAGHQAVRRALADVAGREDDALRVVVAEAEDRIGEVERVSRG